MLHVHTAAQDLHICKVMPFQALQDVKAWLLRWCKSGDASQRTRRSRTKFLSLEPCSCLSRQARFPGLTEFLSHSCQPLSIIASPQAQAPLLLLLDATIISFTKVLASIHLLTMNPDARSDTLHKQSSCHAP